MPGLEGGRGSWLAGACSALIAAITSVVLHLAGTEAARADPQPQDPAAVIVQLFKAPDTISSLLAPSVDEAGARQLGNVAQQLVRNFGDVEDVEYTNWKYRIRFAKALAFADASFDSRLRLASFNIVREAPRLQSIDQVTKLVARLGDKTSVLIEKGGKDVVASDADAPLAVGSTFKLSYLAALADAVKAGHLSWNQLVPLQAKWQALPTGVLQDWPTDEQVTLGTLASLMISLSDNTAADAVMDLVGRDAVQKYADSNDPILTPREYFVLSGHDETTQLHQFLAGDRAQRATILQSIATAPLPQNVQIGTTNPSPIEWHFSTRQLCTLIEQVHALPAMQINPGLADRIDWSEIAYKGGSDHGVFNMTTRLAAKQGEPYCLSVTINAGHELNETQIVATLTGIVFFLHDKSP